MLITKFNKLIRNRVLWIAFAVVVCVSFVGFGSSRGGCEDSGRNRNLEGRLDGEDVSYQEFYAARFFALGMRPPRDLSPEANTRIREMTWQRLAVLRAAQRLGLSASAGEVGDMIRRDPTFAVNGIFDRNRYQQVVQSQLRVPVQTYESYLQQEITIQKLGRIAQSMVWVAPSELVERMNTLTDRIAAEYVVIPADTNAPLPEISTADAQAFFDENSRLFQIPDQANVKYVAFSISNYLAAVTVSTNDVEQHYNDNLEQFSATDTNGVSVPLAFEDVREEIERMLRRQQAVFDARDEATTFVMGLAPDRYGNATSFDKQAASAGLAVQTSGLFSAYADVPGIAAGLEFNRAAFELEPGDPENYFSDAVTGNDAVYVMALLERQKARDPDFEEVAATVIPLAASNAMAEAFLAGVRETREALAADVEAGKTFTEAAVARGLNVTTTETFTVYDSMPGVFEYYEAIIPGVMDVRANRLTEVLEVEGGALVACVTTREAGDPTTMQMLRPDLQRTLDRYRGSIIFADWGEQLLANANVEDLRATATAQGEDEEE